VQYVRKTELQTAAGRHILREHAWENTTWLREKNKQQQADSGKQVDSSKQTLGSK
jgi:hypothetical protein